MIKTTQIQFPNGKTLVLNCLAVVEMYTIAFNAVVVDQNGQLSLDFS